MTTAQDRVRRGVARLDTYRPGWRSEIDTDRLDLGSMYDCVLGQLYGSFSKGKDALCLEFGDNYGFAYYSYREELPALNRLWLDEIEPTPSNLNVQVAA